jgi:hypothetical protein
MNGAEALKEQIKLLLPDVYQLLILGEVDPYVWAAIEAMLAMREGDEYGEVQIIYQAGKINYVWKKEQVTAGMSHKASKIKKRQLDSQ